MAGDGWSADRAAGQRHADPGGLAAWFAECYGAAPEVIWRAPGRANLIGEHTDYNDGLVLPFALERGVLAAASSRSDGVLEVRSRQRPEAAMSIRLDDLRPGTVSGWAGYAAGAAWALRVAGYPVPGVNLAVDSDLPIGAGLASSAALSCSVVSCLAALSAGARPSPRESAALARSAEADFVGVPCGAMDQLASMLCEAGHALLIDCGTATSSAVPLDPSGANLQVVVVDTGVRHELVDGRYAARRSQCEQAARELGVPSLSVLTDGGELGVLSDELLRRRARHVINENQRVRQFVALLRAGRLADCGGLLSASHASLRDDFEVSWPAADVAVTAALAAGALGARMTGGGFGGSVLVLLPADRLVDVTTSVSDSLAAARAAGDGAPQFLAVLPGPGAVQVWPPPDNAAQSSDC